MIRSHLSVVKRLAGCTGVKMSCTACPTDSKCSHIKHSTIQSIIKNGKTVKTREDDEPVALCESSSSNACSDKPPGFMQYIKRCFKSHFRGNSSKKHKCKPVQASDPMENEPNTAEVEPRTPVSDPIISTSDQVNTCDPLISEPKSSNQDKSEARNTIEHTHKSLAMELINLAKYGWYWGPITQAEAVEKLLDQPDGSFLVRDSHADHYLVSMSFRSLGKIYHTRINHCNGKFFFYTSPAHSCASIHELIELSMDSSKSSIFCYSRPNSPLSPSLPIRLTRPVSRFTQVRSLQHLCRFVIRQYTRIDQIKDLPLPNSLCGYIEAKQF